MRLLPTALACAIPLAAHAMGGHDAVGCAGCHSMHAAKGEVAFALPPNTTLLDPRTGKANGPLTALCLSCHAATSAGGRGVASVADHFNHPFSTAKVNPRLAQVPPALLRDGRFECVGCHDPHPSNPNYRYLRVAVTRAPALSELCSVCHPRQSDRSRPPPSLFTSMDEQAKRPAAASPGSVKGGGE